MSRFFVSAAEVLGLFLALVLALNISVPMVVWLSLGILVVALFVLVTGRHVPRIGSRGKALAIISVAAICLIASATISQNQREERLVALRETDVDAYLTELSRMNEARWLSALQELRPRAYSEEMAKREAAQAAKAEAERRRACTDQRLDLAYIMIQGDVRSQLKAPSTAKFPTRFAPGTRHEGDCIYRVVSYVDAQNSFGAMIRTNFEGRIRYYPESKSWQTMQVRIDR